MPGTADDRGGRRRLGLAPAIALVAGHTIGVGIFLTPAEVIGAVASPALTLMLWLACGALVLAGAFTFAELASRYPVTGGLYVYLRAAWGERVAFLYGWQSLLVMDPGVTAALATGMSAYAATLLPAVRGSERSVAVAAIWLLALVSMAGLRLSAGVLTAMTALKFLAFAAVLAAAFASAGSWAHFEPFAARHSTAVPLFEALALAVVSIFFSFGGFWEASRMTGEIRDDRRTLPLAFAGGVLAITAVYVATTVAFIYVQPIAASGLQASSFGPAGSRILAAVVVLSVVTSQLGLLVMAPRLYLAMSAHGLFPRSVAAPNVVTGAPIRATLVLASLATAFVLAGSFQQILAFFMSTTLIFVALAAAGLLVVRRRDRAAVAHFVAPGGAVTPAAFVALLAVVILLLVVTRPREAVAGFGLLAAGLVAYELWRGRTGETRA